MRKLLHAIRSRISYQIILPYLALTLLVMMVGAAVSLWFAAASWDDRIIMLLTQRGRDTSDALVQRERDHLLLLQQVVNAQANPAVDAPSMPQAFADGDAEVIARAMRPYYTFQVQNPNLQLDRMIGFDTQGRAYVDWLRVDEDAAAAPVELTNTDLSQVPDVQTILAGRLVNGSDKFSNLIRFGETDPQPYFYTVAPVRQNQRVVGGVLVAIKLDRMLAGIQRSSEATFTAVYDLQGNATANTVLRRDQLAELEPIAPPILEQLRTTAQSSFDTIAIQGREMQVAYSPLQIAGTAAGYFAVGIWRDTEFSWLLTSRNSIIAIAFALAIGAILLGYTIARYISRPLSALAASAQAVTAGYLEPAATPAQRDVARREDEIGILGVAFSQMTGHLLRLYHTSRDLSATVNVAEVLNITADAVTPLVPQAEVYALLKQQGHWSLVGATGTSVGRTERFEQAAAQHPLALESVFNDHEPRLLEADEPLLEMLGGADTFPSVLLVPLVSQQATIGALLIAAPTPEAFAGRHSESLSSIANMSASVLSNSVLVERIQDDATERAAILESIADGVVVCDAGGTILLMNTAARTMLGDDGATYDRMDDVPLQAVTMGQDFFRDTDTPVTHYRLGQRIIGLSRAPVREGERVMGDVYVLHDMSAEAAVDRAKTKFIETISHELRTPLTVVSGYTELLLRGYFGELSGEQRDMLDHVRARAEHMNSIFKNVVLVASLEADTLRTEREPLFVGPNLHEVTAPMQAAFAQKGLELHLEVPEDLPPVLGDREQFHIVLNQLIDNARRYTSEGSVTVRAYQSGDMIRFDIADTGIGIAPEDQTHLFTSFYRVEGNNSPERGSGLGLTIARQIVERLGGDIWVTSAAGQGSTFSFTLPMSQRQEHADPEPATVIA